jgi:integrase
MAGRWVAEVREGGKYRSRSWMTKAEAETWAKSEAAKVVLGMIRPTAGPLVCSDLVAAYRSDLVARGRSAGHLREIDRITGEFARAVPIVRHEAKREVLAWLNGLVGPGRGLSGAGRNKYLVCVRGLFRWAIRHGWTEIDPTAAAEKSSVDCRLRPAFSLDECRSLVACQHRARAWVCLMLYSGLRADEALRLRRRDVDARSCGVVVSLDSGARVKRRRERWIPLQLELSEILAGQQPGLPDDPWSIGLESNPRREFEGFLEAAGVAKAGRSPHSCRHTYAALMTASGTPSLLLMAYMGHTSTATTAGYVRDAARFVGQIEDEGWERGKFRLLHSPAK